jgi:3-isopropylmalate/(R)-2-methylmalate dehydratase small subunit
VLNRPESRGAQVPWAATTSVAAVSGARPWALLDYGIRAVISTGHLQEHLKNGLLHRRRRGVARLVGANPGADVLIDVATTTLEDNGKRVTFQIDRFSRYCLMNGVDQLGFLLEQREAITRYEQAHA